MTHRANKNAAAVRVIAGHWRGRKIPVQGDGIRPTGDRVRETLFNWLAPVLTDARCLDWFAGSGALGIEALSRGAAHCVFVERDPAAASALRACLGRLGAAAGDVFAGNATAVLRTLPGPFDIVFVDPPFDGPDICNLCTLLEQSGLLADSSRIYLEMRRTSESPALPPNWRSLRQKNAGQVSFMLAERCAEPTAE
ncbi:MAG: 16S rRNA (guanine(966)-N(2))-methyltransferase RsmD [Gammaproteobacteria bacterium]|jgi:16S rRNA (guanine966-N2)-methyltransferase|nr:16S rRNA (guanine(966)-N(2))-methyltransferase RsmD [Gammaproteobacteria bacterium]